ncbi:MAG: SIS domain-containing protein [candidate division KSB1 bacterium]|nr:SIS domain-containing protein [candidate division KSB1 bacterium]
MNNALLQRAKKIIHMEIEALKSLADQLNEETLHSIIEMMSACSGHILVAGAGTSRAVAQRFAHLLSCCGTPALPINAADALHGGAGAVRSEDVVYIISKGGESREINRFAEIAKRRGARIIAQTENPISTLGKMSDCVYHVKSPDVDPYGMIATGSSLFNSLACDILCVLLLERRGYSKEQFGETHPEGAVGLRLASEERAGEAK